MTSRLHARCKTVAKHRATATRACSPIAPAQNKSFPKTSLPRCSDDCTRMSHAVTTCASICCKYLDPLWPNVEDEREGGGEEREEERRRGGRGGGVTFWEPNEKLTSSDPHALSESVSPTANETAERREGNGGGFAYSSAATTGETQPVVVTTKLNTKEQKGEGERGGGSREGGRGTKGNPENPSEVPVTAVYLSRPDRRGRGTAETLGEHNTPDKEPPTSLDSTHTE